MSERIGDPAEFAFELDYARHLLEKPVALLREHAANGSPLRMALALAAYADALAEARERLNKCGEDGVTLLQRAKTAERELAEAREQIGKRADEILTLLVRVVKAECEREEMRERIGALVKLAGESIGTDPEYWPLPGGYGVIEAALKYGAQARVELKSHAPLLAAVEAAVLYWRGVSPQSLSRREQAIFDVYRSLEKGGEG